MSKAYIMHLSKLPNDILDRIYEKKHRLEMQELSMELIQYRSDKVNDIMKVLRLLQNQNMQFTDPDELACIWTAFRNEGLISTEQLIYVLTHVCDDVMADFWDDEIHNIDIEFYTSDTTTSLNYVHKQNDMYMKDALILHENYEMWMDENVDQM